MPGWSTAGWAAAFARNIRKVPVSGSDAHAPQTEFEPEIHVSAIRNSDRSVGAGLSGQLARDRAAGRAPHAAIAKEFQGSAGQSFGAFLGSGIDFKLEGEANDYVGKGLSGGTIAITAGTGASIHRRNIRFT